MVATLIACAIGGVLAILLSLPLHSPDDVFFNSASVAIGAMCAGLGAGVLWRMFGQAPGRVRRFEITMAVMFALVAVLLLAGDSVLDRTASFGVPLAAVVLGTIAAGTPALATRRLPSWAGVAALVPLLALGGALVQQRDARPVALALPTSAPAIAASAGTAAPATPSAQPGASAVATLAAAAATPPAASGRRFRTLADVQGVAFAVGAGSEARFTVREQLRDLPLPNDATMHNTALVGAVRLDGQPSVVQIDLRRFRSDQSRRDQFITRLWGAQPMATVTINQIGALPVPYAPGELVTRRVAGTLAIMGFEGPIAFDIEARMDGDQISILGRTRFKWSDYRLAPPNIVGNVQVQDEVAVEVLLVARPAA